MPDRKPDDVLTARDEVAGCREGSSIHCVGYGALGLRVASPPPGDRIIPGVGEGWGAVELLGAHAPPSRALLGGARDDIDATQRSLP